MSTYSTDDEVCFSIEVRVPHALAGAFRDAMTGHDDDIILAAERAMRGRIGADGDESIELATSDEPSIRAALGETWCPVAWCGCGATTSRECAAAVEGYFTSLAQRSRDELRSLADGDDCRAARVLLNRSATDDSC